MKKCLRLLMVMMLMLGLVFTTTGCGQEAGNKEGGNKKLVVATEATFAPFEYVENGEFKGFDIDIIHAIAAEQGYEVEISNLGFDSLIPALQTNKVDCVIAGMSITPERVKAVDFTDPYFNAGLIVAVKSDNNSIKGFEDLKGKRVAAQVGTIGADACNKLKAEDSSTVVKIFDGVPEAFMELEKGGIDAVVNDMLVTREYLEKEGQGKIKTVGEVFSEDDQYGIAVKKGNQELLDMLNEGLKKIKENGEYDKIYQKYFKN